MFDIEIRNERKRRIVAPFGELDIATRGQLEQVVTPLLDGEPGHVVLDLRGVSFMDGAAAGLLVSFATRARREHIRFSLILGARPSYRVLELCGMLELFERIAPDGPFLRGLS